MATGTYAPNPFYQFSDDDGNPLSGGFLYTYAAGTTTPQATYTDVGLTVPNTNPIVFDSAGRCTIFLSPTSYKFILKNSAGVTIDTADNVGAIPVTNIDNDVTGTAGEDLVATEVAYLSASTWLKADADATTSSTLPPIGFVVSDVDNGDSGSFRVSGRMTGFVGLTPGSDYYVSGTAGAITASAPTNARYVGRADSTSSLIVTPNPPPTTPAIITALIDPRVKTLCNGRLTLTTAVPVTSADVTAATTLYWALYGGNEIALYSGTAWVTFAQAQLSIAVPATTATMYDVFVDYNSGTPALSLTAWTNDTTRATALTTQDGVLVLTGSTGKRFVGCMRTTAVSGQTEDSFEKRFVWNYYNRVPRGLRRFDTTNSWTYSTATYQQANASTSNQVAVILGVAEDPVDLSLIAYGLNASSQNAWVAIGYDSTTVPVGQPRQQCFGGLGVPEPFDTRITHYPAIGYHFYAWLERAVASGTTTWYGDNNDATLLQAGLTGAWRG